MFELSIVCVAIMVSLCELGQYTQQLRSLIPGPTHRTRKMAWGHLVGLVVPYVLSQHIIQLRSLLNVFKFT